MVGFATDLRARKHEEEELRKAHDELEKRVEDRTTELKAARERLRYLMTVTPAIVYTNLASDYTVHLRQRERVPHHGIFRVGDARRQSLLDRASPSRGRQARLRGNGPADHKGGGTDEYRFRHRDGHYIWIQDTFRVSKTLRVVHSRSSVRGRISPTEDAEDALGERMAVMNDLETLVGCEPRHHLHNASLRRLCLHIRQRQSEDDHGRTHRGRCATTRSSGSNGFIRTMQAGCSANGTLIRQGGGALEYRFRHRDGHYIWIQDTLMVVARQSGKTEGDRRVLGRRVRSQARRGRTETTGGTGRAAQQIHPRDTLVDISRRGGGYGARIPERTANGRGEAQAHHDDDRSRAASPLYRSACQQIAW